MRTGLHRRNGRLHKPQNFVERFSKRSGAAICKELWRWLCREGEEIA
jgi:hypothetical protein